VRAILPKKAEDAGIAFGWFHYRSVPKAHFVTLKAQHRVEVERLTKQVESERQRIANDYRVQTDASAERIRQVEGELVVLRGKLQSAQIASNDLSAKLEAAKKNATPIVQQPVIQSAPQRAQPRPQPSRTVPAPTPMQAPTAATPSTLRGRRAAFVPDEKDLSKYDKIERVHKSFNGTIKTNVIYRRK
jgi:hypothetical protein